MAKVIESYVEADEVERALWMLANLPGKYRDMMPMNLFNLRSDILRAMITPHGYLTSNLDSNVQSPEKSAAICESYIRGILLREEVRRYNQLSFIPHLVDMGPGEYFLPLGLKELGLRFSYWDLALDRNTGEKAHPLLFDVRKEHPSHSAPGIFVALEIIEHLHNPQDLVTECLRYFEGRYPDRIHVSTPLYTYDGTKKEWRKPCGLPHLRTYSPNEFFQTMHHLFPGYKWEMYQSRVMSMRGCRFDATDGPLFANEEALRQELDKAVFK